jgi:hypothetical protein
MLKDSKQQEKQTVNQALNETYKSQQTKQKQFTDKERKKQEAKKNNIGGF